MDFQQLECLVEVCKYNSFTRAANALFLSQSSVSKNIAMLEQELGISLLERSRHKVAPTNAGIYLSREAAKIVRDLTTAAEYAKQIASGKRGFIKIGVSDELDLNGLIPGFINAFSLKYPETKISIAVHNYRELDDLILNETLDVAFGPCRAVSGRAQNDLKSILINRATPRLYFSKDHKLAGSSALSPEDFLNDPIFFVQNRFGRTLTMLNEAGLTFHNIQYVNSLQAVKLYVEANQGVTVLGESYNIINSSCVDSIPIPDISEVGTDMVCKIAPSNESTLLFFKELEKYVNAQMTLTE